MKLEGSCYLSAGILVINKSIGPALTFFPHFFLGSFPRAIQTSKSKLCCTFFFLPKGILILCRN